MTIKTGVRPHEVGFDEYYGYYGAQRKADLVPAARRESAAFGFRYEIQRAGFGHAPHEGTGGFLGRGVVPGREGSAAKADAAEAISNRLSGSGRVSAKFCRIVREGCGPRAVY